MLCVCVFPLLLFILYLFREERKKKRKKEEETNKRTCQQTERDNEVMYGLLVNKDPLDNRSPREEKQASNKQAKTTQRKQRLSHYTTLCFYGFVQHGGIYRVQSRPQLPFLGLCVTFPLR
jgi:hypothetical protein